MKRSLFFAAVAMGFTTPAQAASRSITLAIPGMTCAACPITVKKALAGVNGVSQVRVRYLQREVVVIFDDTRATTESLTRATANAGYPSIMKR